MRGVGRVRGPPQDLHRGWLGLNGREGIPWKTRISMYHRGDCRFFPSMRRPIRVNGSAGETRFGRAVSPLDSGVAVQLVWAGTLATLLWVAAAWAMGWLP